MIVKKYYPFSNVKDPEFKKFVQMLNPGYTLPSRNTVSNSLIPRFAVCLTTDCWTSVNNTSFLAVTAHFLNGNMELKSYCLDCTEFSDRHTGQNIGERIITIARAWDIDYKVTAVVSDNAANVVAGIKSIVEYFKHSHHALSKLPSYMPPKNKWDCQF
ncbi:zinc finger BED domain-containing protein 1-like [Aphis craccivora]|uniref:Zinc finger BED domain-containing protein 1-like n=1 Tax=Aphis craccivora TaxID=307492 RepID=A0A6G0VZC1_APHCR|nr:zinc finger BED domain-containing protein 1-like [Aphis craccivora]